MNLQEYLDQVCSLIRFREIRPQVRKELESHLDEIIEESLQKGKGQQEAEEEALRRMGPAQQLGQELDQAHRPRFEWSLILISGIFTALGLFTLYSIQSHGLLRSDQPYLSTSLVSTAVGALMLLSLSFWDYAHLRRASGKLYAAAIALLFLSLFTHPQGRGYGIIITFVPVNFIPATPFLLLVSVAGIFSRPSWRWKAREWGKALGLLLIPILFYCLNPSFPSIILFVGGFLTLVRFSGANWKQTLGLAVVVPFITMMFFNKSYQWERLTVFLHPWSNPKGMGYNNIQLHNALYHAKLHGQGAIPLDRIPNFHTDFIFAYLVNAFGWLLGVLVLGLVFLLIIRLFKAAYTIKDYYGRLLSLGSAVMIMMEFAWNLLMTFGLLPIIDIPLPFISYGGTLFISQMLLLGLVMSAYRRRDLEREGDCPSVQT
ncbi:MAG TPA: FtsW/RodA/SpoVE family cell cycle protein [Syntrophomonadaceae bacterium]|nr:FtsW/RodA/SpoVE family cell cycle protein [Syntrophomonadaceae bacterium]